MTDHDHTGNHLEQHCATFAVQNEYTISNFKNIFTWLNKQNRKKTNPEHTNFHSNLDGDKSRPKSHTVVRGKATWFNIKLFYL